MLLRTLGRTRKRRRETPAGWSPGPAVFFQEVLNTARGAGYLLGHGGEVGEWRVGQRALSRPLEVLQGAGLHERCASSWGQARVGPWNARVPAAASSPQDYAYGVDIPG